LVARTKFPETLKRPEVSRRKKCQRTHRISKSRNEGSRSLSRHNLTPKPSVKGGRSGEKTFLGGRDSECQGRIWSTVPLFEERFPTKYASRSWSHLLPESLGGRGIVNVVDRLNWEKEVLLQEGGRTNSRYVLWERAVIGKNKEEATSGRN